MADRPGVQTSLSLIDSIPGDASRISLKKLGDFQRLDQNGDGVVSIREAERALFGPVTLLDAAIRFRTIIILGLAPVVAITAYNTLPEIVDNLSPSLVPRVSQDSRELSRELITSVLLPTNSLLFGTLVSTTISRQWERQRRLREELNSELQLLEDLVHYFQTLLSSRPSVLLDVLAEIRGYLVSLLCECSWRCSETDRRILGENQREHAFTLHTLVYKALDEDLARSSRLPDSVVENTATATDSLITQLNNVRSRRRSARDSEFPNIHWLLVSTLGGSVLAAFLTECAGALDVSFAEAVKVRVAFAFVCSFLTVLTALLVDLSDPFTGEYQVDIIVSGPVSVLQLAIRTAVQAKRKDLTTKRETFRARGAKFITGTVAGVRKSVMALMPARVVEGAVLSTNSTAANKQSSSVTAETQTETAPPPASDEDIRRSTAPAAVAVGITAPPLAVPANAAGGTAHPATTHY